MGLFDFLKGSSLESLEKQREEMMTKLQEYKLKGEIAPDNFMLKLNKIESKIFELKNEGTS
jgi:hypothetical protein